MATEDNNNSENKESEKKGVGELINVAKGLIAKSLALKASKPKVFYGAIGGVVLLFIIVSFSGGNPELISQRIDENLVIGQTYTLKNPNAAGGEAMTSIVKEPCLLTGYDRTMNDDLYVCLAPGGTKVEVLQLVEAHGVANLCAKVKVQSGSCQGKEGWTLSNNID